MIVKKTFYITYFTVLITLLYVTYAVITINKDNRINTVFEEHIESLDITYKQALDRFKMISDNVYLSIQNDEYILDNFEKASFSSNDKKKILRNKVYEYLETEFRKLQMLDVLQIHFVLPNNESFLRMHKPNKYGDDLSSIRYSIAAVNDININVSGFEGGKTTHAFRYVYPMYKDGIYIGAMDVSFSSTVIQSYSMRASSIHTHFIVNKKIFEMNIWKSKNNFNYHKSIEHDNFLFSMSHHVDFQRLDKTQVEVLKPAKKIIDANIAKGKKFAIKKQLDNLYLVVAFLPIRNVKNDKTAAYLVSYRKSEKIVQILNDYKVFLSLSVFTIILTFIVIFQFFKSRQKLKKELEFDELTKVFTRKHFMYLANFDYEKASKLHNKVSVVMMDIDYFKNVNDTYGHQVGDVVLEEISKIVSDNLRRSDYMGRYGGEEFIVLINADKHKAESITEKIRKKVEETSFCTEKNIKVTLSFGISQNEADKTLIDIIKDADKALYNSKNNGRNRVSVF